MHELTARTLETVHWIALSASNARICSRHIYWELGPIDSNTTHRGDAVVRAYLWWCEEMRRPSRDRPTVAG
jgi:hypothetical protein